MQQKKAIVIGSGVAGMAAAIRLAVQGFAVKIFEQNNVPGGKLTAFTKQGYSFDAGPSLFTQPDNIEELFTLADENIATYFTYQQVPIACTYFYENGKIIDAYTNKNLFAKELEDKVGEPQKNIIKYLTRAQKLYENVGTIFLNYSLHKTSTWFHWRTIKALFSIKITYLVHSLAKYNTLFKTPETQQIFNRYATYNGSNPYKAPAMLSLIPHLEQNQGTFYPIGGMISITNALHKLAIKKGVQFYFNSNVQQILTKNNVALGAVVQNKTEWADVVISNADVYYTYKNLLQNNAKALKILQQERSSSALVFYWGIHKKFTTLGLHNIFFTKNYAAEFDCIFNKKTLYADPTIYINITSKQEQGHAPNDCENWFVMINSPAKTDYNATKILQQAKEAIIKKLNRILQTNIEDYIETEQSLHPQLIQQNTGSYLGSLYGTSSNAAMAAFLRHSNFSSSIKNLYHCGGSVHPGGGIPLCLKSAKIVAELILKNDKN